MPMSPAELGKFAADDTAKWANWLRPPMFQWSDGDRVAATRQRINAIRSFLPPHLDEASS
jgi:hypothetical protein